MVILFSNNPAKTKRHLEDKLNSMSKDKSQTITDSKLTRNNKAILELFSDTSELSSSEIAMRLGMNTETVKKNLKSLVGLGYLIKHGTTKGAWYKKA